MTALPKYIDLAKLEDGQPADYDWAKKNWAGIIALADLARVYALRDEGFYNNQITDSNPTATHIKASLAFSYKRGVIWVEIMTQGELWQTCQRCLEPVAMPLDYHNTLALLKDETQLGLLDEEADYLLLNELAPDGKLNPLTLIEDELLITLPLSPKHSDCEMAVSEVGDFIEVPDENPFAILAGLKTQQ